MAEAFIDYKRAEWDDYHTCVSDRELARYLEFL
jgi:glutamine synthetase